MGSASTKLSKVLTKDDPTSKPVSYSMFDSEKDRKIARTIMLIGIGESGKHTLSKQLRYIYEHDLVDRKHPDFVLESQYLGHDLLLYMLRVTHQMREKNPTLIPNRTTMTSESQLPLIEAFECISDFVNPPFVLGMTDEERKAQKISRYMPEHNRKLVKALRYIWTQWFGIWNIWDRHWHWYQVNHEVNYYFLALKDDQDFIDWLNVALDPKRDEVKIPSDEPKDPDAPPPKDFLKFTVQDYFRIRQRVTGVVEYQRDVGAVNEVICYKGGFEETTSILQHWARVECELNEEYWYRDLLNMIHTFVGKQKKRFEFKHSESVFRYRWFLVGSQRVERRKWASILHDVSTFLYVSSLSSAAMVLFEDESANGLREDLELFELMINTSTRSKISKAVLVFTKKDTLRELIEKEVALPLIWEGLSERVDYAAGLSALPEKGMTQEQWLQQCVLETIERIRHLYLTVPGAQEFVQHVTVLDPRDTMQVCTQLLSPEMFASVYDRPIHGSLV